MEAQGECMILRPSRLIKISRTEKNPETIQEMYDLGCRDGEKALKDILEFWGENEGQLKD